MKLQLYELVETTTGFLSGNILKKVDLIEWVEYSGTNWEERESGFLHSQFESIEEFEEKVRPLIKKEQEDTFNLYGISSSYTYTLLPIIKL